MKRIRVKRETCGCEAYPFCEHASNAKPLSLADVRHGDKVTILVPNGIGRNGQEYKEATGKAVMRGLIPGSWVLNMGGPHGTPGVATEKNFVRARRA
jgi:hypothetical protein